VKALDQVLDIGPKYGAEFARAGIRTVYDLAQCHDVQELSLRSGIPLELVTQWRQQAEININASRYRRNVSIGIFAVPLLIAIVYAYVVLRPEYARRITSQADALSNSGNYEQAVKRYKWAILLDSKNELAYANKGLALSKLGEYDSALDALKRAMELNPHDPWPYTEQGNVFIHLGEYARAVSSYEAAIKLDSNDEDTYANEGLALHRLGENQQAVYALTQAINMDPNDAWADAERGIIYQDALFEYEPAYQDLTKASGLEPNNPDYSDDLAEAAMTTGRFEEAYTLSAALIGDPKSSSLEVPDALGARFIAISALLLQGKTEQARVQLGELAAYYRTVDASSMRDWNFSGDRNYLKTHAVDNSVRNLILDLTDLLSQQPTVNIEQLEKLAAALK
jgi:tetratricopeptide (TPR) repeat protein